MVLKKKIMILIFIILTGCSNNLIYESDYFKEINSNEDLIKLINLMSNEELVLLGESTHGTQEYYEIRRIISQKLIENHNFKFIAVEGDWNSIYEINLYIKGLSNKNSAYEILKTFNRWPTWMWANEEIRLLAEWLKEYNQNLPLEEKISIYGFDVYDVENSIKIVENISKKKYECLSLFTDDFSVYAHYLASGFKPCNKEAETIYNEIRLNNLNLSNEEFFYLKQNAFVVKNGEKHYRAMVDQRMSSWNERVIHMNKTIKKIIDEKKGKGIIWAHNTHVGDARATEMIKTNTINIGQLFREANKEIFVLGFGTYEGKVLAGSSWGSEIKKMNIPKANRNSYEFIFNSFGFNKTIIFLNNQNLPFEINKNNNNRAIGVIYNPLNEYPGNYVNTDITKRYDAFIFIRETNALKLLD